MTSMANAEQAMVNKERHMTTNKTEQTQARNQKKGGTNIFLSL